MTVVNWKGVLHVFHQVEVDVNEDEDEEYEDEEVYHTLLEKYDQKENQWITMTLPAISSTIEGMFVMKKKFLPKPK